MDWKRLNYNYDLAAMGNIQIPYDKLLRLFGPPTDAENDEKIRIFWAFQVGDFKFSIHDYGNTRTNPRDIKTWSVGSYRGNTTTREMKRIYVGGILSDKDTIERGMIYMVFNLHLLENSPPYMNMLYVE